MVVISLNDNGMTVAKDKGGIMKRKFSEIFWFFFFLIAFLAQVWPLYLIANRVYPLVLGMPFSMFWIALWIVIIFIGLIAKYNQEYSRPSERFTDGQVEGRLTSIE